MLLSNYTHMLITFLKTNYQPKLLTCEYFFKQLSRKTNNVYKFLYILLIIINLNWRIKNEYPIERYLGKNFKHNKR